MGRPADAGGDPPGDTSPAMAKKDPLMLEIAALLAEKEGEGDPAHLERALTDGYARALSLEAERWRLEQRIDQLTSTIASGGPQSQRELAELVRLLKRQEGDIGALRADLGLLRKRHSSAVRARV